MVGFAYLNLSKRRHKGPGTLIILEEGIKSAHLRNAKPNQFNGKYYISLYQYNTAADGLNLWLDKYPKFVISDIEPLYADRKKLNLRRIFINTKVPLRTSEWDGEYQQYLLIHLPLYLALQQSDILLAYPILLHYLFLVENLQQHFLF